MTISESIRLLCEKKALTREASHAVFTQLMGGQVTPVQIAALLIALRVKGETPAEITGAAEAMREAAVPVKTQSGVLIDTCGTGGDQQGSINVSTIAAFVVAGAGFQVAKHGNRSVSSRCGSADVLEALGLEFADALKVEQALLKTGITFLFAPIFHPAMKHAMPVRKELGAPTTLNLLAPLTNPAPPTVQIVGVFDPKWVKPLAQVLAILGCEEGLVVHGQGHDEIVLHGPTQAAEIIHGRVVMKTLTPQLFGFKRRKSPGVQGDDASSNAKQLLAILSGEKGEGRDAVCMNAAAVIRAAQRSRRGANKNISWKESAQLAAQSIDSGCALNKLKALKAFLAAGS